MSTSTIRFVNNDDRTQATGGVYVGIWDAEVLEVPGAAPTRTAQIPYALSFEYVAVSGTWLRFAWREGAAPNQNTPESDKIQAWVGETIPYSDRVRFLNFRTSRDDWIFILYARPGWDDPGDLTLRPAAVAANGTVTPYVSYRIALFRPTDMLRYSWRRRPFSANERARFVEGDLPAGSVSAGSNVRFTASGILVDYG